MADIKKIYLGPNALKAVYHAADKVFDFTADTTAPTTTPRPVAGAYTGTQTVYLDVNEPCDTYYTTNGDTPTIGGATTTHYTGAITISATTTLKYFSKDTAGNVEAVKSAVYTITSSVPTQARYVRLHVNSNNTMYKLYEIEVSSGGVNVALNKLPTTTLSNLNNSPTGFTTGSIAAVTDGNTTTKAMDLTKAVIDEQDYIQIDLGQNYNLSDFTVTARFASLTYMGICKVSTDGTNWSNLKATSADNTSIHTYSGLSTITSYRYLKILGYGTATDATTRILEFEVMSGGVNIMNSTVTTTSILSYDPVSNTATPIPSIDTIRDGNKATTSNTYPFWYTTIPNANVVVDFGSEKVIDQINYYSYSVSGDQRTNKFIIQGSNTNNGTDWVNIFDNNTSPTVQPNMPSGYTKLF